MTSPYTIVAVVDRMGYLYCSPCARRLEKTGLPVYAGATHSDEPCDSAGHMAPAGRV
jgi:hypothetical protein